MIDQVSSETFVRWAQQCRDKAHASRNVEERQRLLKMAEALSELAISQAWLEGKSK